MFARGQKQGGCKWSESGMNAWLRVLSLTWERYERLLCLIPWEFTDRKVERHISSFENIGEVNFENEENIRQNITSVST